MGRGTSAKFDRRGAPIPTSYPKWQFAWPVIELFWVARSMASAYCGISLWPVAISLKATRYKPLCRSHGRNGLDNALPHLGDDAEIEMALRVMNRSLRPGGHLIMSLRPSP